MCSFKEVKYNNPEGFEILTAIGTLQGHSRKIAVIACYMPPNLTQRRASANLAYIEEMIIETKRRLKDPYIVVTGDFNQWRLEDSLQEFRDMVKTAAGPTRGTNCIDRTFTNMESVTD